MPDTLSTLIVGIAAVLLAGCSSYSEIARWKSPATTADGEVPLGTFLTQNFSYQLFGCIPLCTGLPCTTWENDDRIDEFNVQPFANKATVNGNLTTLKAALKHVGSNRIVNLETVEEDSSMWSLLIVNRHEVHTKCLILKPKQ